MENKIILNWEQYLAKAREVVAEGCILIKNQGEILPLAKGEKVAIFGRIQNHYYKSGTGSGGMVNVSKVTNIVEGLRESQWVEINETVFEAYNTWEEEHPFEEGKGWGNEPWSQEEMPVTKEFVQAAAKESETAIVILGRTAGEDKDSTNTEGSYRFTEIEMDMMRKVRQNFSRMVVLLNVGGIVEMDFLERTCPDAVMYVWQGGMTGGSGTADVLTGKVNPSGKLTDTIAYEVEYYPSHSNFGDDASNTYQEDIYVGYRYFSTFAPEQVRYPFGYGLSYTEFTMEASLEEQEQGISFNVKVTNVGEYAGKDVAFIYMEAPQGKLGKAKRSLVDFKKTPLLQPGESVELKLFTSYKNMSSYDDSGVTGHKSAFLLEQGVYTFYLGGDVNEANAFAGWNNQDLVVVEQLEEALAPVEAFSRLRPGQELQNGLYDKAYEATPTATIDMDVRRQEQLPPSLPQTGNQGIKLQDVCEGRETLENFVAQFSDEELASIVRGEGMGSSRVTPGTASAFGGVSQALVEYGIPAVCCDDGPSGMRLDCGIKAFSLPNGTMIASTMNPDLIQELYAFTGYEMVNNKVEFLLGPGMNIHRHPLNGRNFEYFSEDSYVTGVMACSMLKGLQQAGVTGTIKHFCGNNQEWRRRHTDSIISERALREIYLKGFEMAVKGAKATSVMTTYGMVNGLYTSSSYDLNTTILRKQWGFKGIVMTDWWAAINERGGEPDFTNFAAMLRAQNDLYMCCPDGETNASGDNTVEALQDGRVTRGEVQRVAMNICQVVQDSQAMKRLMGKGTEVEIINRPKDPTDINMEEVEFSLLDKEITIPLLNPPAKKDTNYVLSFDVKTPGIYKVYLTGSSELGEVAQLPCTLFINGFPIISFTFNGTGGKAVTIEKRMLLPTRFSVLRLYVSRNGLDLQDIRFVLEKELDDTMEFGISLEN